MFPFLRDNTRLATDYTGARVVSASVNHAKTIMELIISVADLVPPYELSIIEELISKEFEIKTVSITANARPPTRQPAMQGDKHFSPPDSPSPKTPVSQSPATTGSKRAASTSRGNEERGDVLMGRTIKATPTPMSEVTIDLGKATVKGEVCAVRSRHNEKNDAWQLIFDITDFTGTITVFKYMKDDKAKKIAETIKKGMYLTVSGTLQISNYDGELQLVPHNIVTGNKESRLDNADEKRVELHLHTKMSAMDALTDTAEVIRRAAEWGHPAIAVTDHGVVQSFPDASIAEYELKGKIKVIYGVEGYFRNDEPPPSNNPAETGSNHPPQGTAEAGNNPTSHGTVQKTAQKSDKRPRTNHIIILVKTQQGLKNLYKLVTKSHLEDCVGKRPIILKSALRQHREGLIIGSACENGELFEAITEKRDDKELRKIAEFYDYLEIQPICNNYFMLSGENPRARDENELREFNKKIVSLGEYLNKPVVATGDVHFLDPEHEIFRRILLTYKEFKGANDELPIFFKTTEEMLEEFSYLGEEKAYEVVIRNPRNIADMCSNISPLPPPKKLFAPKLEGSSEDLKTLVYTRLKELYGENPPDLVNERVEIELRDILDRGYDVIYMTAQKIVSTAIANNSIVGSRGSVGSSFVAFLAGITEVNALPAHYRCPNCKTTEFDSDTGQRLSDTYGCGVDMPDKTCTSCGTLYIEDGFNIPFETFLGFDGDKVPDIDLNFSGEYQNLAHKHTTELFGADYVYRVGTIGKLADKTAYRAVKKYLETNGKFATKAEINRLALGCEGVKQSTGQHAGGLLVIPGDMEITDFCPAQHPADDPDKGVITTHFDKKCMDDNLIKLDLLGHDNPTMLKMLEEMTGIKVSGIKFDDPDTMSLFTSPARLGLPEDDVIIGKTGMIGIPEFGTGFTREMLCDVKPKDFDTLIRISGYSHGTGVWTGNAKDLINGGKAARETIGCREDIMLVFISKGIENSRAFQISENVRKGKGIARNAREELLRCGVPLWYIESCNKITYLFPKAHATAYVMEAFRIAWFKVHKPLEYYSAYFYRRSKKSGFDAAYMTRGKDIVRAKIKEVKSNPNPTKKEEELLITLESCYEYYMRGFDFTGIDLYESDPEKFLIVDENKLRPPFIAVNGMGEASAFDLAEQRKHRKFISIDDIFTSCPSVNKNNLDHLKILGALRDLPDSSQMSLF